MRQIVATGCCLSFAFAAGLSFAQTGEWTNTGTYQTIYDYADNWKDGYVPKNDGDSATFPTAVTGHKSRNIILPSQSLYLSSLSGLGCHVLVQSKLRPVGIDVPDAFYGTLHNDYQATTLDGLTDRTLYPVLTKYESASWSARFNYLTTKVGWDVRVPDAGTAAEVAYFSGLRLRKTGSGVLSLGGVSGFDCRVDVREGALRLLGRAADAVPAGAFLHVDASDPSTLTLVEQDGVKRVTEWRDVDGGTNKAVPSGSRPCPVLRENALNGRPVLDFGTQGGTLRTPSEEEVALLGRPAALAWAERSAEIREAFIVVCDVTNTVMSYAIGDTVGYDFEPGMYSSGLRAPFFSAEAAASVLDGDIRVDGVKCPQTQTHAFTDWKVLSVGVSGTAKAGAFALDRAGFRVGGCRIAEAIFYTNALTVAERTSVNAYLAGKWFSNAGRHDVDAGTVAMAAGASLDVPGGRTARVGRLTGTGAPIVKTGAGTLVVDAVAGPNGLSQAIDVREGEVRFERLVPESPAAVAPGAYLHLDAAAADTSRWTFEPLNGTNFVAVWADVRTDAAHSASALGHTGCRPYLVPDVCNGRPVVDFGPAGTKSAPGDAGWLRFAEDSETPAQEVFLVVRDRTAALSAFFLGAAVSVPGDATGAGDSVPFHRGSNGAILSKVFANTYAVNGAWTMDGCPVDATAGGVLDGNFHVIRFSGARGLHAGLFGCDRGDRLGGFQMGEALVYDRRLSESERRATETYLLKKWLDRPHPFASNGATVVYPTSGRVETETGTRIERALGAGSFVKAGAGSLTLGYLEQTFDSLNVEGGALVIEDGFAGALQKAFYHADASAAATLSTQADGDVVRVSAWRDAEGGNVSATKSGNCERNPILVPNATNGLPVVDFGPFKLLPPNRKGTGDTTALQWSAGMSDAYEIHLIVADRADSGGQFLMGATGSYDFHRGGSRQLLYGGESLVPEQLLKGYIAIDARPVIYSAALPEGLHLVSFAVTNGAAGVNAGAFAMDRDCRYGGLQIGEAMAFNAVLSETERAVVQDSLLRKWFSTKLLTRSFSSLKVASGSSLSAAWDAALRENADVEIAFTNGVVASALAFGGALSAAGAGTLRIVTDGSKPKAGDYLVATAGEIDAASAAAFARQWQVTCPWTASFAAVRLVVDNNRLLVRFDPKGLAVLVR